MWVDSIGVVLAALGGLVAAITACVAAVNWVVKRQVLALTEQIGTLDRRFVSWIEEHERRHDDEQAAVASAFERSGMYPPDGWGRRRGPPRPDAGEQQ